MGRTPAGELRVSKTQCRPQCCLSTRLTYSRVLLGPEVLCGSSPRAWLGLAWPRPVLFARRCEPEKHLMPQFPLWLLLCAPRPFSETPEVIPAPVLGRWQGLNSARCPAWLQSNRPRPPAPRPPLRCRPWARERAVEPPPAPGQFTLFLFSPFLWLLGKNGGGGRRGLGGRAGAQETGRSSRRKAWAGKYGKALRP